MVALSTLLQQFLRERQYLKNVTPKTIIWYESAFLALTRTATSTQPTSWTGRCCSPGSLRCGLSAVSCNTYLKAVNAFLTWLHAEGT